MHWSTDVYHASEFNGGNIHILPKTSHLWILSGKSCKWSDLSFSLFKDQDQMHTHSRSLGEKAISNSFLNNDFVENNLNLVRHKLFSSKPYAKSGFNSILYNSHFRHPIISPITSDLLAKRRRNRFIMPFPFQSIEDPDKQLTSSSDISIEIPVNGIFRRNSILAHFDDPQYRTQNSGIPKYKTIGTPPLFKKEDLIEYEGVKECKPKYQIKVERFFFIPEEVHLLSEL
ncbi:hypothetical protein AHAS_Ahas05G0034100 [Arachis hypogaea]